MHDDDHFEQPDAAEFVREFTPGSTARSSPSRPLYRGRLGTILFAIFCLEVGLLLIISPWTDVWDRNALAVISPDTMAQEWAAMARRIWQSFHFRGAVSGLGVVNVVISVKAVISMRTQQLEESPLE